MHIYIYTFLSLSLPLSCHRILQEFCRRIKATARGCTMMYHIVFVFFCHIQVSQKSDPVLWVVADQMWVGEWTRER